MTLAEFFDLLGIQANVVLAGLTRSANWWRQLATAAR
jgi:hypothetical protein